MYLFIVTILPLVLLILGIWLTTSFINKAVRMTIDFNEMNQCKSFYWEDALKYEPTSDQWEQLQELSKTELPNIPELVKFSADLQWAICMRNLTEAQIAFEELEKKMYILNLHNYESLEKPTQIGPGTANCYWDC